MNDKKPLLKRLADLLKSFPEPKALSTTPAQPPLDKTQLSAQVECSAGKESQVVGQVEVFQEIAIAWNLVLHHPQHDNSLFVCSL